LTFFRGVIWYRQEFTLVRQARNAKTLKLWFGGVDSKARVWLNGQDLGEQRAGNFGPLEFDISEAVRREAANDLLVAVDNTFPNEIGMGGLLRPVLIYTPRP
jgi:beta-galactosidase/beta-glucuronidase